MSLDPRRDRAGRRPPRAAATAAFRATSRSSWTATAAGRRKRGLPRVAGHRAGAEAVRKALEAAAEAGVEVLTLYAFSSENWRRSEEEVTDLTGLLRFYLERELEDARAAKACGSG